MSASNDLAERPVACLSFEEKIRLRANQIYLQSGKVLGSALDDWLQAER